MPRVMAKKEKILGSILCKFKLTGVPGSVCSFGTLNFSFQDLWSWDKEGTAQQAGVQAEDGT